MKSLRSEHESVVTLIRTDTTRHLQHGDMSVIYVHFSNIEYICKAYRIYVDLMCVYIYMYTCFLLFFNIAMETSLFIDVCL